MGIIKTFNHRGTTINKIDLFEYQDSLDILRLEAMGIWSEISDGENDHVYVSNGFLRLLNNPEDMTDGEWHHYFIKDEDSSFTAEKFSFNDRVSRYGMQAG